VPLAARQSETKKSDDIHSPRLCHHVMSFAEKKAPQPAGEA
jgi:hypothetical protein